MSDPDPRALESAVAALRRVIANLRKTRAPVELLARAERELDALHRDLAPFDHLGPYAQRVLDGGELSLIEGELAPAEIFPYSPIIGPGNPIAPPIEFVEQDGALVAEHVFDAPWCGPPASVHGGVIALVFDELLGCVNVVNDLGGFTGTLQVRYQALTPIGRPIRMRAWVDREEGRKIWARGTMHDGETLCSEAEGVFIRPRPEALAAQQGEGVGAP